MMHFKLQSKILSGATQHVICVDSNKSLSSDFKRERFSTHANRLPAHNAQIEIGKFALT